jgi:hypothetical protein
MNGRTDPNEPVSNLAKFYGACSITLRSAYLNQIYVNGAPVNTGLGPDEYGPDQLDAELTRELEQRVPNAYVSNASPYIPPPPEVAQMVEIKDAHVEALRQWLADGKPTIPQLGPSSQGQGG